MENNNPIICDPTSKEAQKLIGQECEFHNCYIAFKKGKTMKGILKSIDTSWIWAPFSIMSSFGDIQCGVFIRKALKTKKLSEEIRQHISNSCTYHTSDYFLFSSDLLNEAANKLEELGE
jgi:hypothetical protein